MHADEGTHDENRWRGLEERRREEYVAPSVNSSALEECELPLSNGPNPSEPQCA
jgi:hypothetical protein